MVLLVEKMATKCHWVSGLGVWGTCQACMGRLNREHISGPQNCQQPPPGLSLQATHTLSTFLPNSCPSSSSPPSDKCHPSPTPT